MSSKDYNADILSFWARSKDAGHVYVQLLQLLALHIMLILPQIVELSALILMKFTPSV